MNKKAVFAGSFYPDRPDELTNLLNSYKQDIKVAYKSKAIIVPHAGVYYSGYAAMAGFQHLELNENIFIIAPSHHNNFDNIAKNFIKLKELNPIIIETAKVCVDSLKNGNKILFCGNGGSAADSQHLATELVGKYKLDRKPYRAIALTTNSSIITASANDFSYDVIFERQVESLAKKGDVLFGISTSGNSKNVVLKVM